MEESQQDCDYTATNVDPVMFDIENKCANAAVLSDVSDSLSEKETSHSREAAKYQSSKNRKNNILHSENKRNFGQVLKIGV